MMFCHIATTRILTDPDEIRQALRADSVEESRKAFKAAPTVDYAQRGVALAIGYLTFDRVTKMDHAHYLCIANNSVLPSVSKRVVLNVRCKLTHTKIYFLVVLYHRIHFN